jgi:hypothetical protein
MASNSMKRAVKTVNQRASFRDNANPQQAEAVGRGQKLAHRKWANDRYWDRTPADLAVRASSLIASDRDHPLPSAKQGMEDVVAGSVYKVMETAGTSPEIRR